MSKTERENWAEEVGKTQETVGVETSLSIWLREEPVQIAEATFDLEIISLSSPL